MALANYTDLVNSINSSAGWLHRNDLSAIIPDWITLCEQTINNGDLEIFGVEGLRTGSQETLASGSLTANLQTLALPSGFLEMRRFYIVISGVKREMTQRPIMPMSLSESSQIVGPPSTYWVIGSTIYFNTFVDQSYAYVMDYYAVVGPLTSAAPTNWLLTAAPSVYLFGTIAHGALSLGGKYIDSPQARGFISGFRAGMSGVTHADLNKRYRNTVLRSEVAAITNNSFDIRTGGFS